MVALSAIAGGGVVAMRRRDAARISEPISEEWPEIGQGFWLIPNLVNAFVRIPDRPHSHKEATDVELRGRIQRTRDFLVNTNDLRMRGGPVALEPTPGVFRIACLGDSVTFGWGVADDEAWPAVLQRQLAEQGIAVECLNLGVPAQGIEAMSRYVQVKGPELGLDAVVLCERRSGQDTLRSYSDAVLHARFAVPHARMMVALPPISRFDVMGRMNPFIEGEELARSLRDVPVVDLTQAIWDAQPNDRGHDLVVDAGTARVVSRKDGEVVYQEPMADGLKLTDAVYQLFENNPEVREPLMFDAGHPDAEGFIPFAREVGDAMIAEGWFG